jgi:prepilin peptidase CpaA
MSPEAWVAGLTGVAASVEDLWHRQISNWIPLAALVGGFACHAMRRGWMGLLEALGGAVAGFLVFLIFYILGGMGGGDVKLMAGFGAVLGWYRILEGALWTAGIGGIFALAVIAFRGLKRFWKKPAPDEKESEFIPYAPAITLGVWLALIPK